MAYAVDVGALAATIGRYRDNARRSLDEVKARNESRFRDLVRYAVEHSPYYEELVREHRIDVNRCRLEDFPPLTKPTIIREFDRLVTTPQISTAVAKAFFAQNVPGTPFMGRYYLTHSSGTSGPYSITPVDLNELAGALAISHRFYRSRGRRRTAMLFRRSRHFPSTTVALASELLSPGGEFQVLDLDASLDENVRILNDFQPDVISSYTGVISRLAHEQREGRLRIKPTDVQVGGEILYPAQRQLLEHTFGAGANIVDVYSSCECLYMGWRSSGMDHLQLLHDEVMWEIHDDHIFCTNLFNRLLPHIRYRMDDQLDVRGEGSSMTVLGIRGRVEATARLRTVTGEEIDVPSLLPYALVGDVLLLEGVTGAQLAVLADDHIDCRVLLTPQHDGVNVSALLRDVEGRLRTLIDSQGFDVPQLTASVATELVTRAATGKRPAIVDLRPSRRGAAEPAQVYS